MSKLKTKSGAKKRFKVTSSGKIKLSMTATIAVGATAEVANTFTTPGRY